VEPLTGRSGVGDARARKHEPPAEQDAERDFNTQKGREMTTEISTQTQPRGLALQTFADAMKFGETVANSDFAPKDFRGKPASCMLAIQAGAEIGLAPLQALQSIAVVNGRPAVFGDAALAVCKASPVCEYVIESIDGDGDQMVATCEAKRRGYPKSTVVRFAVADAKKANLWGKAGPWSQYPKRMLQMRARGFALRDAFPDVLKGLVTAEEAADYPTLPENVKSATQAGSLTVAHMKTFTPPEPSVVKLRPEATPVTDDPVGKARLEVSKATTLERLDKIRAAIGERGQSGTFTAEQVAELVQLCHHRAEMLISEEEKGQEFANEAAEHEVTA
jgi:hypothetical protein